MKICSNAIPDLFYVQFNYFTVQNYNIIVEVHGARKVQKNSLIFIRYDIMPRFFADDVLSMSATK